MQTSHTYPPTTTTTNVLNTQNHSSQQHYTIPNGSGAEVEGTQENQPGPR